jgi:alpha-D-ribose 1-methylphosphonate 5-triphosphate synthase subunit PhnH
MTTTTSLARVPSGFALPSVATQAVFRRVLDALSRPGRCQRLPEGDTAMLVPPEPLSWAMAALMLTLLDGETRVWLSPSLDRPLLRSWLAFHTGVVVVDRAEAAPFVAASASDIDLALWRRLERGSDEAPQHGATLLLEVPRLDADGALSLSGPGIDGAQRLGVGGVADEIWRARQDEQSQYPLGVDLLLCCDDLLAGLPRSTQLRLEA